MEKEVINFKDIVDIVFKLIDKIDSFWNLYAGLNLGVVAWLLVKDNQLNVMHCIIATFSYLLFAYLIGNAMIRSYIFLQLLLPELKDISEGVSFQNKTLLIKIRKLNYKSRISLVVIVQTIVSLFITYLIWFK